MKNQISLTTFRHLVGQETVKYISSAAIVGLFLFFSEIVFIYVIQFFLLSIGVADSSKIIFPRWFIFRSPVSILAFVFLGGSIRALFLALGNYVQSSAANSFALTMRIRLSDWIYGSNSIGASEASTLFNERVNNGSIFINYVQNSIVQMISLIMLWVSLLVISVKITLVSTVFILIIVTPVLWFTREIKKSGEGVGNEWTAINDRFSIGIKNLLLLNIYGMRAEEKQKICKSLNSYSSHQKKFNKLLAIIYAFPNALGIGMVCLVVAVAKKYDSLSSSVLLAYFYLFIRFVQSSSSFVNAASTAKFYWPQLKNLFSWWTLSVSQVSSPRPTEIGAKSQFDWSQVGWEIEKINFKFEASQKDIFTNWSGTVPASSVTAIIGASGVGKSTLLGILLGQLELISGQVYLTDSSNRIDIMAAKSMLLDRVGYVGPEAFLIEGTIETNLIFGLKDKVSNEQIVEVLRTSECHFVWDWSDGIQHKISEQGQGLSAGQKQRLALARALLRRPHVLILDEATANLDSEVEKRLIRTFSSLKNKMTILMVTHRVEILKIADHIIDLGAV